jgi:small subunit ribosomal protein S9
MARTSAKAPKTTTTAAAKPVKAPTEKVAKVSQAPAGHGVGRRKSSVARVWAYRGGAGKVTINGKDLKEYFDTPVARLAASLPLQVIPAASGYKFTITVEGGGQKGQAGAVSVGLARALVAIDNTIRTTLRQHGLLTVDARVKERKKYGQKAARRKFQFVKR